VNTLSKVFVVLNLLFAVVFCAFTLTLYSKRVNWKEQFKQEVYVHEEDNKENERKITDLKTKNTQLAHETAEAKRDRREAYEKAAEAEQKAFSEQDKRLQAESNAQLLTNRIQVKDEELRRRYEQIDRMHRIVTTQQKALEVAKANALNSTHQRMEIENELNNSRAQLVAIQKEKARLEKDLHHNSWVLNQLARHGVNIRQVLDIEQVQPEAAIEGKVMAVRKDVNIVMLSVGSDDKVKPGYRFTVFSDDQFVGKVEVEQVFSDMCAARILRDWTKGEVKEGFDVATGPYGN
jgi:uncharacterized protein